MTRLRSLSALGLALVAVSLLPADDPPARPSAREALQPFNDLIGAWRGTGEPAQGTREEKMRNFWQEGIVWEWQFKGDDAWLKVDFDKGKYFTGGELRPLAEAGRYRLTLRTTARETLAFEGTLKDKRLTVERVDDKTQATQRLVFSLLHPNRYLYRYEVKAAAATAFTAAYQVGVTKQGVDFAGPDEKPECVVSGGLGTIPVSYMGKTYYVCCGGCRDAFRDNPEKYIKEYEERRAKRKAP